MCVREQFHAPLRKRLRELWWIWPKTGSVKKIVNRQEVMFILDFQSDYSFDFYQNDGYILMIFLIGILQSKCSCPPRRKIFSSPEYFGELWQSEQFLFRYIIIVCTQQFRMMKLSCEISLWKRTILGFVQTNIIKKKNTSELWQATPHRRLL